MNSLIWKPGFLIVFTLLSCLFVTEATRMLQQFNPEEAEIREFLDAHNRIRAQYGEPPFVWDPMLANFARDFTNQHHFDCNMVHSPSNYGENLFLGNGGDRGFQWSASIAVERWGGEQQFYDAPHNSCAPGKMCGHYTQIVWRHSTHLGCARHVCANKNTFIVCEYDPPGNFDGVIPFNS